MLRAPSPANQAAQPWSVEVITSYIAAYYYAGLTNVFLQFYLAPVDVEEDIAAVKRLVEESYKDFCMLDNWFATLDQHELQMNPNLHLYQEARDGWKPWVKDSRMIYSEIAKTSGGFSIAPTKG